jgi:uncharacterized membrane protein
LAAAGPVPWLAVALSVTLVAVGVALAEKQPCLTHAWDGFQYDHRCYNDLMPLYGVRHLDDPGQVPYVSYEAPQDGQGVEDARGFNEYPVLTGFEQYLSARLVPGLAGFLTVNFALLAVCAVAVTLALHAAGTRPFWLVGWAVVPPLALYAFNNWDLLAVALAMAGLAAHRRGRPATAGLLLALGTAAKIYPAILLVLVGCDLLRGERGLGRAGWRFGLAAAGTLVAANLPVALLNPQGWWATYRFHLARPPTVESLWSALDQLAGGSQSGLWLRVAPAGASLLFLGALAFLGIAVQRGRLTLAHAAVAAVALFLLLNKVQSVQYALWLVPLVAFAELPFWAPLPYLVGDVAVFWTLWGLFAGFERGDATWWPVVLAVLARAAGQAFLAGSAIWKGWRPRDPPDAAPDAAAAPPKRRAVPTRAAFVGERADKVR